MLKEKIDAFCDYYKDCSFPWYVSLDAQNIDHHQKMIRKKFQCSPEATMLNVVRKIASLGEFIEGENANSEGFDIGDILLCKKIKKPEYIYIDWFRFDDIDKMKFTDFVKYFDDLWYPGADDIFIYDDTFDWVLLVEHFGGVSISHALSDV